jgi:hypothetical protein
MKNVVFWDVFLRCVLLLVVTVIVAASSPNFVTVMKEMIGYSETSVLIKATRRNTPEDGILQVLVLSTLLTLGCTTLSEIVGYTSMHLKTALAMNVYTTKVHNGP